MSTDDTPKVSADTEDTPKEKHKPKRLRAERIKPEKMVQMSARDIATARAWREKEGMTVEAIAAHFKKHPSTIQKLFKRMGVKKGARAAEIAEKIEKKIEEEILTDAIIRSRRIKDTREDSYRMAVMLKKLQMADIVEVKKRGDNVSALINAVRVYKEAMSTIRMGQEIRFIALGIKDGEDPADENLPELMLTELTPEQIDAIRSQSMQHDLMDIPEGAISLGAEATGEDDDIVIEGENNNNE